MKCSQCDGIGQVHISAVPGVHQQYDTICPACDGSGELPEKAAFPNNCLACGEPIPEGQKYCNFHRQAE